jgi:AcrR family transcriptional regulator
MTTATRQTGGKGASTRAAVLDRAGDIATAEGLEALTIGRLARELGMSKSGLFGHFGSKRELQLATVGAAAERFVGDVVTPSFELPAGRERLRAMTAGYLRTVDTEAPSGGCFWGSTAAEFDDRPGPVRDAIAAALDAWVELMRTEAEAAGFADPERLVFQIYALTMGANSRYRLTGDRRVFAWAGESIEDLLREPANPPS